MKFLPTLEINSSYLSHFESMPLIITTPWVQGLISNQYHVTLIPVHSFISYAKFPQYPSFTIHESYHAYLAIHCAHIHTYGHVSHHNNHTQTNSDHQRAIKQPNTALSRPTPRSGRRVSLRRDVLAQAGPLRLGEARRRNQEPTRDLA